MVFLVILGIIIALVLMYAIAHVFEEIAEMKGHMDRRYFWWTFLTGIIGMLMVIALPNIKKENEDGNSSVRCLTHEERLHAQPNPPAPGAPKGKNSANPPVHAEITAGKKLCPKCGESSVGKSYCPSCGQRFLN